MRRQVVGLALFAVAATATVLIATAAAPYTIASPGPVYDVLGGTESDGQQVPIIDISGTDTYATDGALDMLTITSTSARVRPTWMQVVGAALDPARSLEATDEEVPDESEVTTTQEAQQAQMDSSKHYAIAAALSELGYEPVSTTITVVETMEGRPAAGVLEADDRIVAVDGIRLETDADLTELIAAHGAGTPAAITIVRDGLERDVEVTPDVDPDTGQVMLGVWVTYANEWPIDVEIRLDSVVGPSAGMMFALGIIDRLTPESLTGGRVIAGTGTIDADGEVGAIGGIVQKLYAAAGAGAEVFLAPAGNCSQLPAEVPGGLDVYAISDLDDALEVLTTLADGGDASALPRCEAAVDG